MKSKILLSLLALLSARSLAIADETLRLQNGTVYHVVDVSGSDSAHILLDILDGGLQRQVWVPLSLLTPDQITAFRNALKKQDDQNKQAEASRLIEDEVSKTACFLTGQIEAFTDNGVIASASLIDVTEYSPGGAILKSTREPAGDVYISGSFSKDAVSGDTFKELKVYPIGIFEQSDQRYKAYTSDIDLAVKYSTENP